jgi:hypothetical protein
MRIALVFHGQPRNFMAGYRNLTEFISRQQDAIVDVFYHCWVLPDGGVFPASPFRSIPKEILTYHDDIPSKLEALYRPVACEYEQSPTSFNLELPPFPGIKNAYNVVSSVYSRTKAMNLVANYIGRTNTHYDSVVSTRFDMSLSPSIRLHEVDLTKVYMSNVHQPRKIFSDNFIICPLDVYLKWFDLYGNLEKILTSSLVHERMRSIGENVSINAEEVMTSSYLFHYDTSENVVFTPLIVDRMF